MNRSISIIVSSNELPVETRKFQDYKIQETSLRQQDLSAMEMVWEEENEVAFKNRSKTQGRLPIIPGDHRRQGIFFQAGISSGTPFPRDIPPTVRLGRSSSFHHPSYPPRVLSSTFKIPRTSSSKPGHKKKRKKRKRDSLPIRTSRDE